MCRLLAFSFDENTCKRDKIDCVANFRKLACDGMVPKGMEKGHVDGWGLSVYGDDGGSPFIYKSIFKADEDVDFVGGEFFKNDTKQSGLAHLRKKTIGETSLENTHPFTEGIYSFIHNGTVERGEGPYEELAPLCKSVTDSERLFRKFLKLREEKDTLQAYKEMLRTTKENYKTYSALNTMLHDGKHIYISRIMNTEHPDYARLGLEDYYTLFAGENKKGNIVICSEKIESEEIDYFLIENNSLCIINLQNKTRTMVPLY